MREIGAAIPFLIIWFTFTYAFLVWALADKPQSNWDVLINLIRTISKEL